MYFEDDYGYRHGYDEDEHLAPYLTGEEVMALLYIGKNTLYKLLNSGELKGFRVGRQWRIPRESLTSFASNVPTTMDNR